MNDSTRAEDDVKLHSENYKYHLKKERRMSRSRTIRFKQEASVVNLKKIWKNYLIILTTDYYIVE